MKSKLSLALAPLKIPSSSTKNSDRAYREALRRRDSSPPPSPYPGRRSLDPRTEAQLRAACVALSMSLQTQEEAQMGIRVDTNTKVDYEALHRKTRQRRHDQAQQQGDSSVDDRSRRPSQPTIRRSTDVHFDDEEDSSRLSRREFGYLVDSDLATQQRPQFPERTKSLQPHQQYGSDSRDEHDDSHADARSKHSHSHGPGSSASTPHSGVSDYPRHAFSTTATSVTPFRSSMHEAKFEQVASERDAQRKDAASRQTTYSKEPPSIDIESPMEAPDSAVDQYVSFDAEIERRRDAAIAREQVWGQQPPGVSTRSSRSNSRVRNFADGFGDYFRSNPNRRVLSRKASRESMLSGRSPDEPRTSMSSSWRTWNIGRRDNSFDISPVDRTGVYSTDAYRGREMSRSEVNLNRALPPLPSLDQWEALRKGKDTKATSFFNFGRSRAPQVVKIAPEADVIQNAIHEEPEVEDIPVRRLEQRDSGISGANNVKGSTFFDDTSNRSSLVSPVFTMDKDSHFVPTPATGSYSPRSRTPHPAPSADVVMARAASHRRQASEGSVAPKSYAPKMSMDVSRARMIDSKYSTASRIKSDEKKGLRRVISGWLSKH